MSDAAPEEAKTRTPKPETGVPSSDQPTASPPASSGPRWIRIALAVSVALNLAVAGLAAGAWLREGPDRGLPREMSFGPFTEALSDADRRELRRALGDRAPGFREARQKMRDELAAFVKTLRTTPFDPAATEAALSAITNRATDRLNLGRDLLAGRILQMNDAERQAFADRLDHGLKRR